MAFIGSTVKALQVVCGSMAVTVLWATLTLPTSAQNANDPDKTEARIATAMAGLQRFHSSHSLDDLQDTSNALFSATDWITIKTNDLVARRRSLVAAYAQVLHQIELLVDPTFDPRDLKNTPFTCLIPPREPSGRQLPSCADPNDISDPATRAEYLAALNANELKTQRYNMELRTRYLQDGATQQLQIVLRGFHSRTPTDDHVALDKILRQAGISEVHRAKINAMF